jgi:hypothetical protein
VSSITASKTPTPPGTWLMMPAITAAAYTPRKVMKEMCTPAGSSDHSTAHASDRSITDRVTCASPIAGPGARSAQPRISSVPRARHAHSA